MKRYMLLFGLIDPFHRRMCRQSVMRLASFYRLKWLTCQRFLVKMFSGCCTKRQVWAEAFGCLVMTVSVNSAYAHTIEWEVLNRFTLFEDALNNDLSVRAKQSAALFEKYSFAVKSDTHAVREYPGAILAEYEQGRWQLGSPFAEDLRPDRTWWDEKAGKYRAGYYDPPDFVVLRIGVQLNSSADCDWTVGDRRITQPCSEKFEAVVKNTPSIPVLVRSQGEVVFNEPISVRHRVILGLGDSYASGEGNPDRPTQWRTHPTPLPDPGSFNSNKLFDWPSRTVKSGPIWLSHRCHRSFWSWQLQAALWQASLDKHSVITFGGYSCSGAEVWDGLLAKQTVPPGIDKICAKSNSRLSDKCLVPHAQISAVVRDLCPPTELATDGNILNLPEVKYWSDVNKVKPVKRTKCLEAINPNGERIERILLSIGGNDIGFSKVIAWGLTPIKARWNIELAQKIWDSGARIGKAICPSEEAWRKQKIYGKCDKPSAEERLNSYLRVRAYPDLDQELRHAFGDNVPPIKIVRYMNPLMEGNGKDLCGVKVQPLENRQNITSPGRQSAWDGVVSAIGESGTTAETWEVNLLYGEAGLVSKGLVEPLMRVVYPSSWQVIDGHLSSFTAHGWCAASRDKNPAKDRDFLYPAWESNKWRNDRYQPDKWSSFKPRERWFRTASDSILTQYESDRRLGGSINGILHPTAQGNAAIADAVVANW